MCIWPLDRLLLLPKCKSEHILSETGLHCQVSKFEFLNAQIQSVYSPADLDLQNERTIIKS